jgi:hypothetical protein
MEINEILLQLTKLTFVIRVQDEVEYIKGKGVTNIDSENQIKTETLIFLFIFLFSPFFVKSKSGSEKKNFTRRCAQINKLDERD